MLEQMKRISIRISSVLSKVEPEPDLPTGSDQKVPVPAPSHCRRLYPTYFIVSLAERSIF